MGRQLPVRARTVGQKSSGNSPANAGHGHNPHMHGDAFLILAPHRQDAIELLDALALVTDARQIRDEDVRQGLANDFVLQQK